MCVSDGERHCVRTFLFDMCMRDYNVIGSMVKLGLKALYVNLTVAVGW